MTRRVRHRHTALLAAVAILAPACDEGPTGDPADTAATVLWLSIVSGDSQIGDTGRLLEDFLVFRVTDAAGRPVAGIRVEWEVVAGGGQVSGKRHETDIEGLAAGNFTLGPEPGEHVARALVRDSLAIRFTAFARPPSPEELLP
ncbi:MAG TPA: hypothetical protein VEY33_04135 [Gemmatimonadota bacterium]|nr:hypothetical protein [Gemmatimonadota bacterium]